MEQFANLTEKKVLPDEGRCHKHTTSDTKSCVLFLKQFYLVFHKNIF